MLTATRLAQPPEAIDLPPGSASDCGLANDERSHWASAATQPFQATGGNLLTGRGPVAGRPGSRNVALITLSSRPLSY